MTGLVDIEKIAEMFYLYNGVNRRTIRSSYFNEKQSQTKKQPLSMTNILVI